MRIKYLALCVGAVSVMSSSALAQNDCRKSDKMEQIESCTSQLLNASSDTTKGAALLYRCQAYDVLGQYNSALADCQTALDYTPRDSSIYNSIAIIQQNLKNNPEAIQASTQAITMNPDNGSYYNVRANAYCAAKRYDSAVDDRIKAMRNGAYTAKALQEFLRSSGFYSGEIDGKFGNGSVAALRRWTQAGC